MAVYPCDWSAHRYPGPQRSAYLTIAYASNLLVSHAARLCQQHFDELSQRVREDLNEVDDSTTVSPYCELCSNPRTTGLYVKLFDQGAAVVDYAADFCDEHTPLVVDRLKMSMGRRLRDA